MKILRWLILPCMALAGCAQPPPERPQVDVSCKKNWYGERVCTRTVSKY